MIEPFSSLKFPVMRCVGTTKKLLSLAHTAFMVAHSSSGVMVFSNKVPHPCLLVLSRLFHP